MPDRLIVDVAGPKFKVSKPGFDVNTSGELDTLFDMSMVSSYTGQYLRGSVTHTWTSGNTTVDANSGERTGTFTTTISLGKTFAAPPVVFVRMLKGGLSYSPFFDRWNHTILTYINGQRFFIGGRLFRAYTTTTSLIIDRYVQTVWVFGGGSGAVQSASYTASPNDFRRIVLGDETYEYMVAQN